MKARSSHPSDPIRVGIIGFGGSGQAQCGHFQGIAGSQVVAIFDTKPGGLARAKAAAPQAVATDSFDRFMAADINTIAVCSPDRTHADYVVAALEARKHVVCEKPLTDSVEGCLRILKAEAKAQGIVAAVQHQMRFVPVHIEMKRLIQSGRLGRISYVEGYYVHNLTVRASQNDDWRFKDNATPLVYSGCHFIDLLRWLLDDEVEEIMGMANNIAFPEYPESDLNVVLLRFRSGVIGKVIVAFGAARPQTHSVRVFGASMSIEDNLLFGRDGRYEVFARPHLPREDPATRQLSLGSLRLRDRIGCYRDYFLARLSELGMRLHRINGNYGVQSYPVRLYPHRMAVRKSLENFVGVIRGRQRLESSLRDAAKTVVTCLAGVEAYRTHRSVNVADFWPPELDSAQTPATNFIAPAPTGAVTGVMPK